MADVTKLPSGRFRKQVYIGRDENGKRIYESFTADTEAEVKLLAAARRLELDKGIEKRNAPHTMTVGEAIDMYIEDRDGVLAPKTIREYKSYRRNYLQGLMLIKLKNIKDADAQREINREAKRLSPKSVRNAWALVNSAILSAMPEKQLRVLLPAKVRNEMNIPTNEQLMQLFKAIEGRPIEIPVLLAATAGLRRGEIAALDLKKDIDYKNNTVSVTKAISNNEKGEWVIKQPKTYTSYRTVELPEWVVEKISKVKDTYKFASPDRISHSFINYCNKLGLNIRFHDLRHYYASIMLALGIPGKYAAAKMGHATTRMIDTVYGHIMEDKNKQVAKVVLQHFDDLQHNMQHEDFVNEE